MKYVLYTKLRHLHTTECGPGGAIINFDNEFKKRQIKNENGRDFVTVFIANGSKRRRRIHGIIIIPKFTTRNHRDCIEIK